MTGETKRFDHKKTRLAITRDLREIERMFSNLKAEAVNRAANPDIPGGAAMVLLGPGVDVEAWTYVQLSAGMGRIRLGHKDATRHQLKIELEAFAHYKAEPPLSFLASWVDRIRTDRGQEPTERRATITGEIAYLRNAIDWITAADEYGNPWWIPIEEFADGLHKVRRRMEDALHDGDRADRVNAECAQCDEAPRLIVHIGAGVGGRDFWQCPNRECRAVYDDDGLARCWRAMLVKRGDAPEWLTVTDAAVALGRSPWTIRRWIRTTDDYGNPITPKVASKTDDLGRTLVSWSDTRQADRTYDRRSAWRTSSLP